MKTRFQQSTLLSLFCGLAMLVHGQVSPTLSAGLTSLTLEKGEIDVALLSQIIADKQEEVRKELLQRYLMNNLEGKGFAIQNYLYSSFHSLLTLKDLKAIEKELLSQVTILALQVGFAEALLKISFKQDTLSSGLRNAMVVYLKEVYPGEQDYESRIDSLHLVLKTSKKLFYLFELDEQLLGLYGRNQEKDKIHFSGILLDNIYEVMRLNNALNEKGFIKIHPNLNPWYNSLNQFIGRQGTLTGLNDIISRTMDLLVEYHPLFADFINDQNISIEDLHIKNDSFRSKETLLSLKEQMDTLITYLDTIKSNIRTSDRSLSAVQQDGLNEILSGLWDFQKRNEIWDSLNKVNINDYSFIVQVIEPFFVEGVTQGLFGMKEWDKLQTVKKFVYNTLFEKVYNNITAFKDVKGLSTTRISEYGHLIRIITSLSELDKVSAYEHIFNTLAQVGINNLDRVELNFLKDIIYFLETHTSFDPDNQRIQVSVEALLLRMLERYQNKVNRNLSAYFSIGVGQALYTNYGSGYEIFNDQNEEITNLSLASEKIGFKYKFINNQKRRASLIVPDKRLRKNPVLHYSEKALVSDYYFFVFGSGLLYNVANLTSAGKNFDYALVSGGLGTAFFNALDFNLWISIPVSSGESLGRTIGNRQFYGFSFDIKLTEYLTALANKRRQNQSF